MGKNRGVSVGTALLAVSLVAMLGFTLASLSVTHLSLTTRESNSQQAHNLARSAVRQAMAGILEQKSFGLNGTEAENLTVHLEGSQGTGRLSFHRDVADDWHIPVSVNNIQGTASVEGGGGQIVPIAAAHLVGVGESGGVVATVEAILVVPPFPFAIASGGPIVSRGGVLIAGLPAGTEPTLDLTQLDPADLLTNDTSSHSVQLGADTTVAGDIQSAGQVVLDDPTVKVLGEIRSQASPEKIPNLQAEQFDPAQLGMAYDSLGDGQDQGNLGHGDLGQQPAHLSGAVRSNQSVRFRRGLELDGATLFVDGDLVVEGGLKGSGVVVVTGTTTISGGTSLNTENQVAILSEGQINLTGVGPMSSRFQGLLYTDAGLRAEQISLVGTLVARGEQGVHLADTYVFLEKKAVTDETEVLPRGNWTFDLSAPGYIAQGGAGLPDNVGRPPQLPPVKVTIEADGQQFLVTFTPGPSGTFSNVNSFRAFIQANVTDVNAVNTIFAQVLAGVSTQTGVHYVDGTGLVSMEPSQFLKAEEDIRLALWRER